MLRKRGVRTMLGEQLVQEQGQITGTRVLPGEDGGTKVEVSFQASGSLFGRHETDMGTYSSVLRPDGSLFGEGQGVTMTEDGDMIAWRGHGIGKFTGPGSAVSWRGAVYFQTRSERLARLNGVVGIYEHETDDSGKVEGKIYEWK